MEKTWNNKAWFMVLPAFLVRRLLGHHPADDRRQLFGAGHLRQQRVLLGRHWTGSRRCSTPTGFWDALGRNLIFSAIILPIEVPLGIFIALEHAEEGLRRAGLPCHHGPAAADPVERGRHHLADLRAASDIGLLGYTLAKLGIDFNYASDAVRCLDHCHRHGCLALDQPCGAAGYAGLVSIPRCLLPGGARSTAPRAGRSSATSSCRR